MTDWVIAEWIDEAGERVRAPSYESSNGVWYRAGVADVGGPTILRMEGQPADITKIQGAEPQRRDVNRDLYSAVMQVQVRQSALGDKIEALYAMLGTRLNRIERNLDEQAGRFGPPRGAFPFPSPDDVFGPGMLGEARARMQDFVIPDIAKEAKGK